MGVAVAPTDPNRVYVVSGDTNGFDKGFFVSNDGGDTFQTAGHANNESEYQWWFGRIWVDPGNENHVFVADVNLRQSSDGGQTWSSIGSVHADQHAMAWDPGTVNTANQSAERIYLGNDGGIYHTDSDGTTNSSWVHATYEPWNQAYHIAVAADNDNRLATDMQDNGSLRTWTAANPSPADTSQVNAYGGGDGHYVAIDQTNDKIYCQCSQNGNCRGVQDNGNGTQTTLRFGRHLATATRFTADAPTYGGKHANQHGRVADPHRGDHRHGEERVHHHLQALLGVSRERYQEVEVPKTTCAPPARKWRTWNLPILGHPL